MNIKPTCNQTVCRVPFLFLTKSKCISFQISWILPQCFHIISGKWNSTIWTGAYSLVWNCWYSVPHCVCLCVCSFVCVCVCSRTKSLSFSLRSNAILGHTGHESAFSAALLCPSCVHTILTQHKHTHRHTHTRARTCTRTQAHTQARAYTQAQARTHQGVDILCHFILLCLHLPLSSLCISTISPHISQMSIFCQTNKQQTLRHFLLLLYLQPSLSYLGI